MEVRTFAEQVLLSVELEEKLAGITEPFTDASPGDALLVSAPGRSNGLEFAPRRTATPMPKPGSFTDPARRAIAHHIMANHELQALEVMGRVALQFPDAPTDFRLGLAKIMQDEQRHTRMHIERAAMLGLRFGDLPVNSYIWQKSSEFDSLLDYLATLPLLFEGANLDHTVEFANHFEAAGDDRSAALMRVIHRDEIEHVAFGLHWLRILKSPGDSDWDAFCRHLKWPLRPTKARGELFQRDSRRAAGLTDDFIDRLEQLADSEDE